MNPREKILARLDAAKPVTYSLPEPELPLGRNIFSDYPRTDLVSLFQERLLALRGECFVSGSLDELARRLESHLSELPQGAIFAQDTPLIRALTQRLSPKAREVRRSSDWSLSNQEFAFAEAGITAADIFVARTGSIGIRSTTCGGRRLSVLPPVHVVVGSTSQIRHSLENWFSEIANDSDWSFGSLISGPSRTGDIEKILVLGAHGPKKLIVLLHRDNKTDTHTSSCDRA